MIRRALVTGCNGQMGSYLCELLLAKGYNVYGLVRRTSTPNLWRLQTCVAKMTLLEADVLDEASLRKAMIACHPHEVYHLASQSHVGLSFTEAEYTVQATGLGAARLFETVRRCTPLSLGTRIYQASSSEQFGVNDQAWQDEQTPMRPVSPYGFAKLLAHQFAHLYRESYGVFVACGIAFNHESPRRGEDFVTRKITKTLAAIVTGQATTLTLGNLAAQRDWLHAKDVAQGAWQSLQAPAPEDWVFASGETHSVEEFAQRAARHAGVALATVLLQEAHCLRPVDIPRLCGNATKARTTLGWQPTVAFDELVKEMMDADLAEARSRRPVPSEGPGSANPVPGGGLPADVPEGPA